MFASANLITKKFGYFESFFNATVLPTLEGILKGLVNLVRKDFVGLLLKARSSSL